MATTTQLVSLVKGRQYDVSNLRLLGWTDGLCSYSDLDRDYGGHNDGYNFRDYFDADGRYLGPDEFGIQPICESTESPPPAR